MPDIVTDLSYAFARFGDGSTRERVDPKTLIYVACAGCHRPTTLADATRAGARLVCRDCARRESSAAID